MPEKKPVPIVIDTDIGEDIDDLICLAFALNSPEFEVRAVTTVDCDTRARSRTARRVCQVFGRPGIPVAAGYTRWMPRPVVEVPELDAVTQNRVAPDEEGLSAASLLGADELIARLAEEDPGELCVLTIGAMTNVGMALVRFPETAASLRAVITNGGSFGPDRECGIGWNLRYDPLAAAVTAASSVRWILLSESTTRRARLTAEDVERIRTRGLESTDLMMAAIEGWRANKRECGPDSVPHVSDFAGLAYLLDEGNIDTWRGWAHIEVSRREKLGGLRIEDDPEGPHLFGADIAEGRARRLHDLFMERILTEPIHG